MDEELVVLKWFELSIYIIYEVVEFILNILYEVGVSGVVIEDLFDLIKECENVYGEIY